MTPYTLCQAPKWYEVLCQTKAMEAEGVAKGEDYSGGARQPLVELVEHRMGQLIDKHPERMAGARRS
jgi:hypothetical protein